MRIRFAIGLSLALASVLAVVVGVGQGCGARVAGGNGGGYGGVVARYDGQYGAGGPPTPSAGGAEAFVYLRYGTGASCAYPPGLDAVGPYLSGILSYDSSTSQWRHRTNACAQATGPIDPTAIVYADFDWSAAVYGGRFYLYQSPPPSTSAEIERQRLLCRAISSSAGAAFQEGMDALITLKGGRTYAKLVIGRNVGGIGQRYVTDPFETTETSAGGGARFTAESFSLTTTPSASGLSGRLTAVVGGEVVDLSMDCFE